MKHLKNLSSTSKYVGIATKALLNAMEELQIDQKFGVFLRVLRECPEVFFNSKDGLLMKSYVYGMGLAHVYGFKTAI